MTGAARGSAATVRGARAEGFVFGAVMLLAAVLRLYGIGDACYWLDEFYSLEASTGRGLAHAALPVNVVLPEPPALTTLEGAPPWWRIWTSLDLDNHPPLYFLVLRAWRSIAPDGEGTLRFPSAVFGVGTVALFYAVVRAQIGWRGAAAAAAVLAVASSQLHFSQEVRGYALWAFLAVVAAWGVAAVERKGVNAWRVAVLATAALGMLLTHYFAVAMVAGLGLYAAFGLRERRRMACCAALLGACAVYALAWGPFLLRQRATVASNNLWQLDQGSGHVARTLVRAGLLPLKWLSESLVARVSSGGVAMAVAVVTSVMVVAVLWRYRRERAVWFWVAFASPLVVLVVAVDLARQARHLEVTRYTFVAAPAVCAIAGLIAVRFGGGRAGRFVPIAVLALGVVTLPGAYSDRQDWRAVASWLQDRAGPGGFIVYTNGRREPWYAGSLYLGISHYARTLPARTIILTARGHPVLAEVRGGGGRVFVLDATDEPAGEVVPGADVAESQRFEFGRVSELAVRR